MSTCVRKCTFTRACNVGANSLNVVSRTFPHFSQSMLTPMRSVELYWEYTLGPLAEGRRRRQVPSIMLGRMQ